MQKNMVETGMAGNPQQLDALKFILENALHPQALDDHPWAASLLAEADGSGELSPGQRLVAALTRLFVEGKPAVPPRQGKRLDTRWGEFGLLAAQYFAPIQFGAPVPASLREAWGRIDQSILLFVFENPERVSPAERENYKLVANEPEIAPHSTLSDWHRKGLQRLMQAILAREAYLAKSLAREVVIHPDGRELRSPTRPPKPAKPRAKPWLRLILLVFVLLLAGAILVAGLKARQLYDQAMQLRQEAYALQGLLSSSDSMLDRARQAGPALSSFRANFQALKTEVEPFLWITPMLGWLPEYGAEVAASRDLLTYADSLLASADTAAQSVAPLLAEQDPLALAPDHLVRFLVDAEPQLVEAQTQLGQALAARSRFQPEDFSSQLRALILDDLDPLTALMQDGLSLAVELPRALGASPEGPKTYLLLAQNEDELRPTGGFITAAGTILLQDGRISDPVFRNSGFLDDWSKPYPPAPWQLQDYMNSPVLIFRDATWFTHYPTTAVYAEQLYSYISGHSVDGVIAFNQQFLVKLLQVTGPLQLPGKPEPISAANAIEFMRKAKQPTSEDLANPDWDNKLFLNDLAAGLLEKILSGDIEWERLTTAMIAALNERSILIQVDNPVLTDYLVRQGWDGSVRAENGDFLLVADSNIGFNKTSAVVETRLDYEVDLRDRLSPTAILSVTHQNNAAEMYTCSHRSKTISSEENEYPITDCYWTYTRIYRPAGTELVDFAAQFIPINWMLVYRSIPPQVDNLGSEDIPGVQAFGTLKVIPGGQAETTMLRFALPLSVFQLQPQDGLLSYRLRIQKQPGTIDVPISIRVHLTPGSAIYRAPDGAVIEGNSVTYTSRLRTDVEFELFFYPP